jgi:hypothetical protein
MELLLDSQLLPAGHLHGVVEPLRRPAIEAKNDEALETWWEISPTPLTNEQMKTALKNREPADVCLYRAAPAADHPDAGDHPAGQLRDRPGRAGGPVEQAIAHLQGIGGGAIGGSASEGLSSGSRASRGLDPKLIKDIEKQYGFDKPHRNACG